MKLARALLPLLLQACWATAQDDLIDTRAVAFQGERIRRVAHSGRPAWSRRWVRSCPRGTQPSSRCASAQREAPLAGAGGEVRRSRGTQWRKASSSGSRLLLLGPVRSLGPPPGISEETASAFSPLFLKALPLGFEIQLGRVGRKGLRRGTSGGWDPDPI